MSHWHSVGNFCYNDAMNFLNIFSKKSNLPAISNNRITESFNIPEPTKSLLYVTNDDVSKISSPFQFTINVNLTSSGIETSTDNGQNFHGEPSLIWVKLPIERNNELETQPMYFPSYSRLSSKHRYQYLNWLKDITKPTNLSYVFLYYYGLERQLLTGNFDLATQEIFKLLKYHDKGTFRSYAQSALIVSALYKNRLDIFEKDSFLFDSVSNESLVVRKKLGSRINAKELMELSYPLGLKNKRYIKLYPDDFEKELNILLQDYENKNGSLLNIVSYDDMKKSKSLVFANSSIPSSIRMVEVPQIISNSKFKKTCIGLLEMTHNNIKIQNKK